MNILSHLKQVSNVIFDQFKKGEVALNFGDLAKLLILSEELLYKITGANLPKNIKEAIINGKNLKKIKSKPLLIIDPVDSDIKTPNIRELKVKLKNLNIKIEKDVWTTGLGYTVIVTIN